MLIVALNGCSPNQDFSKISASLSEQTDTSSYLSITLSDKVEDNFVTHFFVYDTRSKSIEEVGHIPMTAQYPLGVVDVAKNVLYCSKRDSQGCDQLFRINLSDNKEEKLTENLYAINYMIPIDNKIIMATKLKGTTNIGLASYDLKSEVLDIWNKADKDTCVQSLTLNPYTKKIYASLYSWKERLEKSKKASKAKSPIVIPPVNHIIEYDQDGTRIQELFSTEEQIGTFVVSNKGDRAILRSASEVFKKKELYLIDLKTGKREILNIPNYSPIGDVFFKQDDQGIFFTAFPSSYTEYEQNNSQPISNGLYYYDFGTSQVQTILAKPNSFINNFSLCFDHDNALPK